MKPHQPRTAFTLTELTVASTLTVMLAITLSSTWMLMGRPTSSLIAWGQLFQEMDIAVASLCRDLGGSLPDYRDATGTPGGDCHGQLVGCKGDSSAYGYPLQLCFDGGDSPDGQPDWGVEDTQVKYCVTDSELIREKIVPGSPTTRFVVAGNVDSLTVADEGSDSLRITLRFAFAGYHPSGSTEPLSRTCILVVKKLP